jgi:nucleoside-diphosphate-sugar epimerase
MRVTVTGGTGFLGGFLVRDLLAKGVSVRVLARPSPRAEQLRVAGAEIIAGDINQPESIARAVAGSEVVYHLAARVGAAARRRYFDTNVAGTERVLSACSKGHVEQFVYLSSLAVYGPVEEGERIDEHTPLDKRAYLRDSYSESKIIAERLVNSYAQQTGLPTAIVRPGIIFGPGRPLPIGIFGLRLGSTNFVFGKPEHRFPLNYVENLVDAMQAAASGTGLREYNVLDEDDLTLGRYHAIKSAADGSATRFCPGWLLYLGSPISEALRPIVPMADTRLSQHQLRRSLQDRWYDTHHIRNETGWRPRVVLEEAIQRTLQA